LKTEDILTFKAFKKRARKDFWLFRKDFKCQRFSDAL